MSITTLKVDVMNSELSELLAAFADKYGLIKSNQRISYSEITYKFAVEFDDRAIADDFNPDYFKDCASFGWQHGLNTRQIGKEIKTANGTMKFVGMHGKYAIVQSADNKFWKYDPVMVASLLKAA